MKLKYYNGENCQEIIELLKKDDNCLIRWSNDGIIAIIDKPEKLYKGYYLANIPHFLRIEANTEIINYNSGYRLEYFRYLKPIENKGWNISNRLEEAVDNIPTDKNNKNNLLNINTNDFRKESITFLEDYFNDEPLSKSFVEKMSNLWFYKYNLTNE